MNNKNYKSINYNNYKRHDYDINLLGIRAGEERGIYERIYVDVRRDGTYPFGEPVTDYYEVKYACKVEGFDFSSINWDVGAEMTLKQDSKEWVEFVRDPGIPIKVVISNFIN